MQGRWFCWASPSLSVSAACPLGPAGVPDLLGLLPSDGQQAGGALGELALPNDDQVSDGPCAQQVPVGRGREKSGGLWKRRAV